MTRPAPFPLLLAAALALLSTAASAQRVTFTIDNHGPMIATPDAFSGFPITEGDILTPASGPAFGPNPPAPGPLPPPGIATSAGFGPPFPGLGLALHGPCAGHPPGILCPIEVDALSYGTDAVLPAGPTPPGTYYFSVDEYATGFPVPPFPSVFTEGATGPEFEAAADTFTDLGMPIPGPIPPFAVGPANLGVIDGNGLVNASGTFNYPGLGLFEPTFPGVPPDTGDNVDGLDVDTIAGAALVYFSLDAGFIDPINGFPLTGSAGAHAFAPGDVVVSPPGGPPALFAPAAALGLDIAAGVGSDDLDALVLFENGTGAFEPSRIPYDWAAAGGPDMLLFSVRRGSAVVGLPDSIFGIPIEPGDILTTPLPTAAGGVSPFPGIFIAAENLGLATARGGFGPFGDELDALDVSFTPVLDCNGNGTEDALDVFLFGNDINTNGVPDECELIGSAYCFCPAASAPCGNADPTAGCVNSAGTGALLSASGTSSITNDDLVLTVTQAPPNKFGLFFFGTASINAPFGDGRRCVGGNIKRFLPIQNSGAAGTFGLGPGLVAYTIANFPIAHHIGVFQTWFWQCWYRDPAGPCGAGFNLSNGHSVTFTP